MAKMSTNEKKQPVPFSAEPTFVAFIDDLACTISTSRSSVLRQAVKELARSQYPQVFAKHFPEEGISVISMEPVETFKPVMPASKPPISDITEAQEPNFLDDLLVEPEIANAFQAGAPQYCPSCGVAKQMPDGRTMVVTSTNPHRGKWICNECSSSGEYFPDRAPTVN